MNFGIIIRDGATLVVALFEVTFYTVYFCFCCEKYLVSPHTSYKGLLFHMFSLSGGLTKRVVFRAVSISLLNTFKLRFSWWTRYYSSMLLMHISTSSLLSLCSWHSSIKLQKCFTKPKRGSRYCCLVVWSLSNVTFSSLKKYF